MEMISLRNLLLMLMVCMLGPYAAKAQISISSFSDIDSLVRSKSYIIKNGAVEIEKAKKAKLAGLMGIPDPTGNVSLGYTNNTQLPVSIFPAEFVGGTPGTYEKVEVGTKYNSLFSSYVDIKLLNLSGISNFRLSKLNIRIVEADNTIQLREIYQNATTIYYNILTLQAQRKATEQYLVNAEQLHKTVSNKLNTGLASPQELNDALITKRLQEENLRQIDFQTEQQLNSLKALIDINDRETVLVSGDTASGLLGSIEPVNSKIYQQRAQLDQAFNRVRLDKERNMFLPTLSFVFNYQSQWFDIKPNPFNSIQPWIPSNYFGLRLLMPLPGANQISAYQNQKYQARISQFNAEQALIKDELEVSRLRTALNKAHSEHASAQDIAFLRKQNYGRNLLNYEAGLVTLEYTINSFNSLVDADYNSIASTYRIRLQEQLIMINNTIK